MKNRFLLWVGIATLLLIGSAIGGAIVAARRAEATRNSAGTVSLASGNPVVTLQTISTSLWNNTFGGLRQDIEDSLDRSGRGGMLAALRGIDGVVGAPAFSWTSETGSGQYRIGAGDVGMAILGTKIGEWTANGYRSANGAVATPSLSFFNDTGAGLYRAGSNDLRFAVNGADKTFWGTTGFGIGAAPTTLLQVQGSIISSNKGQVWVKGVSDHGYISIDTDTPASKETALNLNSNGAKVWEMYIPAGSTDLRFYNGTDRVTVTSSGVTLANDLTVSGNATVTGNMTALKVGSAGTSSTQLNFGSCTLNGASPSQCTATVVAGAKCTASTVGSVNDSAAASVSVSATTLTVTKENGSTKVVNYICF